MRAMGAGADAVIFDLEDSVAPENKTRARGLVAECLRQVPRGTRPTQYWVRINAFDTGLSLDDLASVMPTAPDGIVQPKIDGPDDVVRLSYHLDALEAAFGLPSAAVGILPVATETAKAVFRIGSFADAPPARMIGLTWGAEDLSAAIGASTNRDASGGWAATYRLARSLCLLAAHASGVQAIETLYADFRDESGLREASRAARAEGFTGRFAIHPDQVEPINDSFTPAADEIEHFKQVVAAFEAVPGTGAVSLDGTMLDRPHLVQAQSILEQVALRGKRTP